MVRSWKSHSHRYHPYHREDDRQRNRTNLELRIKDSSGNKIKNDAKCAGDAKLTTKVEGPLDEEDNDSSEKKCIICLDSQAYTEMRSLSCGHSFHAVCINRWFKKKSKCPVCRHPDSEQEDEDESDDEDFVLEEDADDELDDGEWNDEYDEEFDELDFDDEDFYATGDESEVELSESEQTGASFCFDFCLSSSSVYECPIHGNKPNTSAANTDGSYETIEEDEQRVEYTPVTTTEDDEEDMDVDSSEGGYASSYKTTREQKSDGDQDSDGNGEGHELVKESDTDLGSRYRCSAQLENLDLGVGDNNDIETNNKG